MRTLTWILGIMLALSVASNIALITESERDNTPKRVVEYIHKTDTVIQWKYDTDTIYMTNTRTKYETKVINDTVWIKDIPFTTTDSTSSYIIAINAVKLNWYHLKMMKNDTITVNTTTIRTTNAPKSGFHYGIGVGVGYGFVNQKPDIFVGLTIGYRFK